MSSFFTSPIGLRTFRFQQPTRLPYTNTNCRAGASPAAILDSRLRPGRATRLCPGRATPWRVPWRAATGAVALHNINCRAGSLTPPGDWRCSPTLSITCTCTLTFTYTALWKRGVQVNVKV